MENFKFKGINGKEKFEKIIEEVGIYHSYPNGNCGIDNWREVYKALEDAGFTSEVLYPGCPELPSVSGWRMNQD